MTNKNPTWRFLILTPVKAEVLYDGQKQPYNSYKKDFI